jgi:hypothetical protein
MVLRLSVDHNVQQLAEQIQGPFPLLLCVPLCFAYKFVRICDLRRIALNVGAIREAEGETGPCTL